MIIHVMSVGSRHTVGVLRRLAVSLVVVAFASSLGHWRAFAQPATAPLAVAVSIEPWADIVAKVGGEDVEVTTLLPPGTSPHSFEPLPSQATLLSSVDLVVLNGGLDSWLTRLLDSVAPLSRRLVIMDAVDFMPIQGHADDDVDSGADELVGTANPHIWLDPRIAARAVDIVAAELSSLLPAKARAFAERAEGLRAQIEKLDAELEELLFPVRDAPFVPFHDAWAYFARRYGLDLVATLEPFPGREPSVRYVAETVLTVRRAGAWVIFDERQLGGRTARVVAESGGLRVVTLDPLGGEPGPVGYVELLRFNAGRIADALGAAQ